MEDALYLITELFSNKMHYVILFQINKHMMMMMMMMTH